MIVQLYDCRDHHVEKYRYCTLRIVSDEGVLQLQGWMVGERPVELAESIAKGLGAEFVCVGPPAELPPPVEPAPKGMLF